MGKLTNEAKALYKEADNIVNRIICLRLTQNEDIEAMAETHFYMEKFIVETMQFLSMIINDKGE